MIDRYTKAVLTVIAAALTALAVQNAIPGSQAQLAGGTPGGAGGMPGATAGLVQRVALCDVTGTRCAAVEPGLGRAAAESGGSLRVFGEMRTLGGR
jgi:hypothetical protein